MGDQHRSHLRRGSRTPPVIIAPRRSSRSRSHSPQRPVIVRCHHSRSPSRLVYVEGGSRPHSRSRHHSQPVIVSADPGHGRHVGRSSSRRGSHNLVRHSGSRSRSRSPPIVIAASHRGDHGGEHSRLHTIIQFVMVAHIHARIRSSNVLVRIPVVEAPRLLSVPIAVIIAAMTRASLRVYVEGDRPSRGHSRSPTRVLPRRDCPSSRHSRTPVSVIRKGSSSRTPSPERATITRRSSSRASRSSRRPAPVVYGDSPRQSRTPSRAHSRGPTIIDHDRGSSGRHTRAPSIYLGDPEYPDPHSAHSRPPSIFGDPDYIDQRPISAPPHPHSHAGSHEDFADAPDSSRRPVGSRLGSHAGSRAPSAYADGDRRPLSPQRSHVTTRAPSEDYADAPDPRRPSRASSRAPSRVSHVPPGRESPVHVVVPTSHRTTPPFTEGNVPRDRVQHPTEYEQARPTALLALPTMRLKGNLLVTRRKKTFLLRSRSRTPGAHTPGTRPPSHAQATAIPSGSQPSGIHVRSPDYDEADGGSRRPSQAPTEIHPDHPEYDDGRGRQPSRASTAIPLDHLDYDGGSRRPSRALRNSAGTHSHDLLIPEKRYGELYEHGDNRQQTFEQNVEERKAKSEVALAELLHATCPMTPPSRPATHSAHDERFLPVETFGDELEQTIVHGGETPPFIPLGSPSVAGSVAPSRHSVVLSRPTSRIAPSEGGVTTVSGSGPMSETDREELSQAAEDAREEAACHAEQEREAAASEAEQERQEETLHAESERAALSEKAGRERLSSVASIAETIISEGESWKRRLNDMEEERAQLLRMLCQQRENQEKDRMRQLEERVETERREQFQGEAIQQDNDLRAQLEEITNLLHEKAEECEQLKALNDERYAEKQERRGKKDSDIDALKEMVQQLIAQNDAIRNEAAEHRASLEGKPGIDAVLKALD
ncbi:hypothetical protein M422DRAFT_263711 [Sphaerobolus stellatus SS14]|uniref:Uncharacterized protein n=1 Tax=Sphaerobolus stellatus (strain SS14) TaxID=990650 RepID=A0A0C9V9S1_SPHS4|nr:hypothetical protein M422DRAFT_263711 [Sphaerobolus stellatus SS14]